MLLEYIRVHRGPLPERCSVGDWRVHIFSVPGSDIRGTQGLFGECGCEGGGGDTYVTLHMYCYSPISFCRLEILVPPPPPPRLLTLKDLSVVDS